MNEGIEEGWKEGQDGIEFHSLSVFVIFNLIFVLNLISNSKLLGLHVNKLIVELQFGLSDACCI